ncbi:tRNA (cytidine/uridine-2'-O-)-methyltransferase [Devosia crocina]|uniref:tRNA (cytidine(34)-2'-O)-methyltransferase n=1 Tax=Devosia crocina TaxID=429728 RepID=A0A1I7N4Q2_9HYPH|nr:tRNA (cytidine(34)-2'-O)-methyltransferase [Devosia crocina]SFV29631.1 tRNA (cytidine/uridine-2'-O-)-methyltransferase [Devosia crocina]
MSLDLALYQPDIAQNTGTLVRLCACIGVTLHIIHPAGFAVTPRNLARAGLDYVEFATIREHDSFDRFDLWRREAGRRLVLLTTKSSHSAYETSYRSGDILMLGRESAGVPDSVAEASDLRVRIPMRPGLRSINVAIAGSMVVGEAMRQIGAFSAEVERTSAVREGDRLI